MSYVIKEGCLGIDRIPQVLRPSKGPTSTTTNTGSLGSPTSGGGSGKNAQCPYTVPTARCRSSIRKYECGADPESPRHPDPSGRPAARSSEGGTPAFGRRTSSPLPVLPGGGTSRRPAACRPALRSWDGKPHTDRTGGGRAERNTQARPRTTRDIPPTTVGTSLLRERNAFFRLYDVRRFPRSARTRRRPT